jgi:hypothetical protein
MSRAKLTAEQLLEGIVDLVVERLAARGAAVQSAPVVNETPPAPAVAPRRARRVVSRPPALPDHEPGDLERQVARAELRRKGIVP